MPKIVFGIRKSKLASAQLDEFRAALASRGLDHSYSVKTINTSGDKDKTRPIEEQGPGVFTKELEHQLLEKKIDCAVHSLKDVPIQIARTTQLSCFLPRGDARDCLVYRKDSTLTLKNSRIATGSPRRTYFILQTQPHLEIVDLRGNVDTRLSKLDHNQFDLMILAACGLKRLGLKDRINSYLDPDKFVPAAGQGIICAQTRKDDFWLNSALRKVSCEDAGQAARAERKVLKELNVGCRMPFGVYARFNKANQFQIVAKAYREKKEDFIFYKLKGPRDNYLKITNQLIKKLKSDMLKV